MSRDRKEQLADWLRYTEDPSYDPLPTYATPKEPQPVIEDDPPEDDLL